MACIGQRSGAARSWFQSHSGFSPSRSNFRRSQCPTCQVPFHPPCFRPMTSKDMDRGTLQFRFYSWKLWDTQVQHGTRRNQGLFSDVFSKNPASPQSVCLHFLVDHLNKPKYTIQRWTKSMRLAFWKANVQGMSSNGTTNKIEQPRNIPQKEHVAESEVKHVQQTHRSDVAPTHTKSNKNKNTNLIEGL